jgi:hypothetical protein
MDATALWCSEALSPERVLHADALPVPRGCPAAAAEAGATPPAGDVLDSPESNVLYHCGLCCSAALYGAPLCAGTSWHAPCAEGLRRRLLSEARAQAALLARAALLAPPPVIMAATKRIRT